MIQWPSTLSLHYRINRVSGTNLVLPGLQLVIPFWFLFEIADGYFPFWCIILASHKAYNHLSIFYWIKTVVFHPTSLTVISLDYLYKCTIQNSFITLINERALTFFLHFLFTGNMKILYTNFCWVRNKLLQL